MQSSKLPSSAALEKQFKENERSYQTRLQVAKFSKIPSTSALVKNPPLKYAGLDRLGRSVYMVFGWLVPEREPKQEYEWWVQQFVTQCEETMAERPFLVLFFSTNLMTHSKLSDFKEMLCGLPRRYWE